MEDDEFFLKMENNLIFEKIKDGQRNNRRNIGTIKKRKTNQPSLAVTY